MNNITTSTTTLVKSLLKVIPMKDIHFRLDEFDVIKDGKVDKISLDSLYEFCLSHKS